MPGVSMTMAEQQEAWAQCEESATRIANQRIARADSRRAFNAMQDKKSRARSGLVENPEAAWGNKTYGAWYGDSVASSWDNQHAAFKEAAHFGGPHKTDAFPWEFNSVGTKSSNDYGGQYDVKGRERAAAAKRPGLHQMMHAEATRQAEKVIPAKWEQTKEQKNLAVRKFNSPEDLVSEWNKMKMEQVFKGKGTRDQTDHFVGAAMVLAEDETEVAHGCRHVENSTIDHFAGGGMTMGASAAEDEMFGKHGRGHVKSIEQDHFVGHSMELDGRGDYDLENNRGVAHVASEGTSAQTSHFTAEYATRKEDAGGEGLYNTSGIISEMKHLGHQADKSKIASTDHFAGGSFIMDENAAEGEMMDLLSAGGSACGHKSSAAHAAGAGDHFLGGQLVMDSAKEEAHHSLTKHVGKHGDGEHSYDHFAGGGMTMGEQSAGMDLLSVGGAGSLHLAKVAGRDRSSDHFEGLAMG